MTIKAVLLDTLKHFKTGDDRYENLLDVLHRLDAKALAIELPEAVTTEI